MNSPAQFFDFASSPDEGLILGENFEAMNPEDLFDTGPLSPAFLTDGEGDGTGFLVANDNADLNGNHFDGDSAGGGIQNVFSFDGSPGDHGAPTTGTYYIEGTADNNIDEDTLVIGHNFSLGCGIQPRQLTDNAFMRRYRSRRNLGYLRKNQKVPKSWDIVKARGCASLMTSVVSWPIKGNAQSTV